MAHRNRIFGSNEVFSPGLNSYLNSHTANRRRWGRGRWRRRYSRRYRYQSYCDTSSSSEC